MSSTAITKIQSVSISTFSLHAVTSITEDRENRKTRGLNRRSYLTRMKKPKNRMQMRIGKG